MRRVTVVGSGASGVHFALTALEQGCEVTLVDVGYEPPPPVLPEARFDQLKERLEDPARYFLGERFQGVVLPDFDAEYYGFPPDKNYVFREPPGFGFASTGFAPLFSFARGGLAQAWTGGCYPLNDDDLRDFPWKHDTLSPYYDEVARRVGVTGEPDDLSRFLPLHRHLLPPLRFDRHSERLAARYQKRKRYLNETLGCWIGRTRVATLSEERGERHACDYLGRCLWGCPVGALYTPSQTLQQCVAYPGFRYLPGQLVEFFRVDARRRVTSLVIRSTSGGERSELPADLLALAAGTLSSTEIVLRSARQETGRAIRLGGLMDNRQVLMPFVNLGMIGQPFDPGSYQYHLLGLGLEGIDPRGYVHAQITTLKTALMHPIIHRLPFDLRTATSVARTMHAALGVLNVNFADTARPDNHVALGDDGRLAIRYQAEPREAAIVRQTLRRLRRVLWSLGCVVPPGMTHVRPMGASVHYAGTLPMSRERKPWTTTPDCRSHDYENLLLVDGATFPSLPAKNLTFTLMANAVRVARTALSAA